MQDYGTHLEKLGLTDIQIVTILCGWSCGYCIGLQREMIYRPRMQPSR